MTELEKLFSGIGDKLVRCDTISGSGSNRQYTRLHGEKITAIGVYGKDVCENKAFIALSRHFKEKGIKVPQILNVSEDFHYYITEDLGDTQLFSLLSPDAQPVELLEKCMQALPDIQYKAGETLDYTLCYPQQEFDRHTVFWDLNYFKYEFLKPNGIEFDELLLEQDFEHFAEILLAENTNTFMFRDFQSRNVMVKDGEPFFIDYQGGRRGPVYYDLASFVYQAKARFSEQLKQHLIDTYIAAASKYTAINPALFRERLEYFVLFRNLQTLGAYGFRGLVEHKAHFIQSIPFGIHNLKELLKAAKFEDLPYLTKVLNELVENYQEPFVNNTHELVVKVYSFSYKKGIPMDYSGNGGGYVFDCRAVHNPGKYEQYKQKTGLDQDVIDFIE
ncbi:MAG: RNase adapter RapZ, partial [Bacteroidales bacterium]|nr:RNase adapter RapZ [Bacteroidales bacterium]